MPTTSVKILGFNYELPAPYSAGHTCSATEADALNKILAKGLSKGLHKVLAAGLKPTGFTAVSHLSPDQASDIAAMGEEYIRDYCIGFSRGHDTTRAERTEANRIARQMLETALYKQGKKLTDLTAGEQEEQISVLANNEKVLAEASRRVKVTQEIAERAHGELLESLGND